MSPLAGRIHATRDRCHAWWPAISIRERHSPSPDPVTASDGRAADRRSDDRRLAHLTDQHRPDAETGDEQPADAVQQIEAVLHLDAIRVDDRDGDDRDEPVEGVELREPELVLVDQDDA